MKNKPYLFCRAALIAVTAGAVSLTTSLMAQEGSKGEGASGAGSSMPKTASSSSAQNSSSSSKTSSGSAKSGGSLSPQDRQFAQNAAKDGMREVDMGRMGEQNGASAEVKKLGRMMVADHTKANNQLMALAQKKGLTLDTKHPVDKAEKGPKFDDTWLNHMLMDHQRAIDQFQMEARDGSDSDLKSFASKTLPTLKKHLQAVQTAQSKLGSPDQGTSSTGPKKKG